VNNSGYQQKEGDRNLFSFYSPMKPLQVQFDNSTFENNTLGKFKNVLDNNLSRGKHYWVD